MSESPVVHEMREQEVSKVITLEQKIQSDARSGVLKHLDGSGLDEQKTQQLHEFADMAGI